MMKVIQCTSVLAFASMTSAQSPMITVQPGIPMITARPGITMKDHSTNLGLCESDCDKDSDCTGGLWCADAHKPELNKVGLNNRTANCIGFNPAIPWNFEVCFDPKIVGSGGAGGDPHFRTYDGTKYTFHGECDLVMAHSQLDDVNEMNLHARTKMIDNWSLISNAALQIGNDIFEVDNDDFSHYFNGAKNVEFPILLAGKYEVTSNEHNIEQTGEKGEDMTTKEVTYTIDLMGKGSITISNYRTMLSVRVDSYLADTYGMLGQRTKEGLVARDGETLVREDEMGAQWQVRDDEPMLFHELGGPQYPETCIMPSVNSRQRRLRASDVSYEAAKKACENVEDAMIAFCVEDVVRSGDVSMAHSYQAGAW